MANLSSIARPYALAAFEYSRGKNELPEWKIFLESASCAAQDSMVVRLLDHPEIPAAKLGELFEGVLASQLNEGRKNFLRLLAQNGRLPALPEISKSFNACYATLEKISTVHVTTAIEINDSFRQKLARSLSSRTQRDVRLECKVDPAILGGAVIHIGDRVIDGSLRGKLTRLLEFSLR